MTPAQKRWKNIRSNFLKSHTLNHNEQVQDYEVLFVGWLDALIFLGLTPDC